MPVNTLHASFFQRFNQLLLIQPTTNAKWSLNRGDNNPSNDKKPSSKTYFPFLATDWRWCWTPKRLKVHLPTFTTGFVLPSIKKIVYYHDKHPLVSFEWLLSLRLSDHFALVVGCINNNWWNQESHFLSKANIDELRSSTSSTNWAEVLEAEAGRGRPGKTKSLISRSGTSRNGSFPTTRQASGRGWLQLSGMKFK